MKLGTVLNCVATAFPWEIPRSLKLKLYCIHLIFRQTRTVTYSYRTVPYSFPSVMYSYPTKPYISVPIPNLSYPFRIQLYWTVSYNTEPQRILQNRSAIYSTVRTWTAFYSRNTYISFSTSSEIIPVPKSNSVTNLT